jgi:uncharacterized protein (DUF305 family)
MRSNASSSIVAVLTLLLFATIVSCSGSDAHSHHDAAAHDSAGQQAAHNTADIDFARNMIPHHQQAVELAAMVPARTANPALRVTATHIGADQQAEIRTLEALLAGWGEPSEDPHATHDAMPMMMGMVDRATLDRLESLHDASFDTLWVTSMISHHQGAVTMAQDEIAYGQSPDAIHVANLIITTQQREIAMMTHLISASQ